MEYNLPEGALAHQQNLWGRLAGIRQRWGLLDRFSYTPGGLVAHNEQSRAGNLHPALGVAIFGTTKAG